MDDETKAALAKFDRDQIALDEEQINQMAEMDALQIAVTAAIRAVPQAHAAAVAALTEYGAALMPRQAANARVTLTEIRDGNEDIALDRVNSLLRRLGAPQIGR